jgi:uncharacterized protein YabN with tetrapyrrole methylase and pyrophosphatase domain
LASGSLTVVGTGIGLVVHLTPEARAAIERADELHYLVADPLAAAWVERLNPRSHSLGDLVRSGAVRRDVYRDMVERILAPVRAGRNVCAAFYGHPGVFVSPSHGAITRARDEGLSARMLPGVSAEDCLFADLGVDPARGGCQSYDATDFLVHGRGFDESAALVLWQIGMIGELGYAEGPSAERLAVLVEHLLGRYPADHEVVLYEATPYPVGGPRIERVPLRRLAQADVSVLSTLYVPPATAPRVDRAMAERLGLAADVGAAQASTAAPSRRARASAAETMLPFAS